MAISGYVEESDPVMIDMRVPRQMLRPKSGGGDCHACHDEQSAKDDAECE